MIGAYAAELGGLDVLIFTAGIGENSPIIRQLSCEGLSLFGITVDEERNNTRQAIVSQENGRVAVMILPTNEERMIVRETNQLISK